MRRVYSYIIGIALIATALVGGFFVYGANAAQTGCAIQAILSAQGAGNQQFLFNVIADKNNSSFTLVDGQSNGGTIPEGIEVIVTEVPPDGWLFDGIDCEAGPGIVINNTSQGFTVQCVNASEGEASCVITNVPALRPVPTLNEWGMITAAACLGLVGVFFAVRRRKAVVN